MIVGSETPIFCGIYHWEESTICKHDGTPKGFCTSNSLLSQKWFPNGQVLNQKVLIYHKSTWNVVQDDPGGKWKLGNLSCVSSEKPDQKYQTLGPFISESFSISQKMCQITILSTIHLKKELRIVIWHIFWRRDGVKVEKNLRLCHL